MKRFRIGSLLANLALLALVLIWTLPTFGLLVSSVRDKDQLAESGWWTALSSSEVVEQLRTAGRDQQLQEGDEYVLRGALLSGTEILRWGSNSRAPEANQPNTSEVLRSGATLTVFADGRYEWRHSEPYARSRGLRVFVVAQMPPKFTFDNYIEVLTSEGVAQAFINTFTVTIPATFIPIMIAAFAAYALSWMRFRGRATLVAMILALMVVPLQMSLIPLLQLYNSIGGWFGVSAKSYPGIWLAHTAFGLPLAIYLLRNYIASLPGDLIESARIDGATHFQIFVKMILPLSIPALASFAIFQFLWVWNDLLVALVFLGKSPEEIVLTSKLRELLGSRGDNWEILTASAFVSIVVPLTVFFSLQRYFVRGLLAGSVKGG